MTQQFPPTNGQRLRHRPAPTGAKPATQRPASTIENNVPKNCVVENRPMSSQLQEVLAQAQKLNHAEQLQLINLLVNHAMPIANSPPVVEAEIVDVEIPVMPAPIDPQCAEFLDEIVQYRRDHRDT